MIDPSARVDPGKLEEMGTNAALLHCDSGVPLSQAVCQVVKDAALTTEHIKRILEFTNVKAYLSLYDKMDPMGGDDGNWMRYISFTGGPALFEDIMDTLDAPDQPQEAEMPSRDDYEQEPENYKAAQFMDTLPEVSMQKLASEETPKVDLDGLYSTLGSAISKMDYELLKYANLEPETRADFLKEAKTAVIHGYSLGDIRKVATAVPDLDLDRALNELAHEMDSAFWGEEAVKQSFEKVSHKQPVTDHPLAQKFSIWKEARSKHATAQATKRILKEKRASVLSILKESYGA